MVADHKGNLVDWQALLKNMSEISSGDSYELKLPERKKVGFPG